MELKCFHNIWYSSTCKIKKKKKLGAFCKKKKGDLRDVMLEKMLSLEYTFYTKIQFQTKTCKKVQMLLNKLTNF